LPLLKFSGGLSSISGGQEATACDVGLFHPQHDNGFIIEPILAALSESHRHDGSGNCSAGRSR
jgi:hypothetical protein